MLKPVTTVIRRQPTSPKPVWQRAELFLEPADLTPDRHDSNDQDDESDPTDL